VTIATISEVIMKGGSSLEAKSRPQVRIARVMPNTPSLVGAGASGFALGATATKADAAVVSTIFGAIGIGKGHFSALLGCIVNRGNKYLIMSKRPLIVVWMGDVLNSTRITREES
jgi:hypothetical protein